VTVQFGGRVDRANYAPVGEASREFTSGSGSLGLLLRPAAAGERLTFALSLARAARNPALEELFYFGAHPGNFAFEIGNPDLEPEHAIGFDLSMRWRGPRASGEITYFRNSIQDYVFRRPVSPEEYESRIDELEERFPGREIDAAATDEFPIVENVGADSVLHGIESHADVGLTSNLFAEVGLDYVRGTLQDRDEPLPRMPPLRGQLGLRFQHNAFQVGGNLIATGEQSRLFEGETPTDGYQLFKIFAAYSLQNGRAVHTITARLDNLTNELYRNHLSLIKDLAPEMGRNFKLLYNVKF
jgi:iron complex outermembrane receptor protein